MSRNRKRLAIFIALFLFVVLLIAPLLNFILSRTLIWDYRLVDENGAIWVGFYGEMIGASITGLISFYILMKEIQSNDSNLMATLKSQELTELKQDLAHYVGVLQFSEIGAISIYPDLTKVESEKQHILNIQQKQIYYNNSVMLKYDSDGSSLLEKKFADAYNRSSQSFNRLCSLMMNLLVEYGKSNLCRETFIDDVIRVNKLTACYGEQSLKELRNIGEKVIEAKRKELSKYIPQI